MHAVFLLQYNSSYLERCCPPVQWARRCYHFAASILHSDTRAEKKAWVSSAGQHGTTFLFVASVFLHHSCVIGCTRLVPPPVQGPHGVCRVYVGLLLSPTASVRPACARRQPRSSACIVGLHRRRLVRRVSSGTWDVTFCSRLVSQPTDPTWLY